MTNRTCVDWSAAILQAVPRSLKTGHPNIHSPRRLFNSRRGLRDWFGYQLTWTIWQPELAARHNGGEYSAASPPHLRKPLESVYLSAGTHPYQQPCSSAPRAEECQKRKGEKEDEAGKEALWKALICTQETYMATPPANAALLEHICVCVGWEGGETGGMAYERRGVNSSLSPVPWDPFCCLQISVEFRLGGRRAEVKRMPWLRLRRTRSDNRKNPRWPRLRPVSVRQASL